MTTENAIVPWWKLNPPPSSFEHELHLWNTPLPRDLRVALIEGFLKNWSNRKDYAKRIHFLFSLMEHVVKGDCAIKGDENWSDRYDMGQQAAAHLAKNLLEYPAGLRIIGATDPTILPILLRKLLEDKNRYFDQKKKRLQHKIKKGLKWLYGSAIEPWSVTTTNEIEEGKQVIKNNLPLLIECFCAYDLIDVIEDTSNSTFALLEKIATTRGFRIEEAAFLLEEGSQRAAARKVLYLRTKRSCMSELSA